MPCSSSCRGTAAAEAICIVWISAHNALCKRISSVWKKDGETRSPGSWFCLLMPSWLLSTPLVPGYSGGAQEHERRLVHGPKKLQ